MEALKVLIVDDAPGNRLLLRHLLRKRQCVVVEAANGQEAIEIALREQPDLILMDLMMPVLDGWEATRRLRAVEGAVREVPIIAVTAAPQEETERALAAGCTTVVAKPIRLRALWKLIEQTLIDREQTKAHSRKRSDRVMREYRHCWRCCCCWSTASRSRAVGSCGRACHSQEHGRRTKRKKRIMSLLLLVAASDRPHMVLTTCPSKHIRAPTAPYQGKVTC